MTPDTFTNQELHLDVGDGHTLYVYDWGNSKARYPIVYLHGGPGGSVDDKKKYLFNPKLQRVIFFDQRGSGASTPIGSLEHNTTQDLIGDITKIADTLQIDTFILHGTSWGSTLALAYALEQPNRVHALVIGGIFTGSSQEIEWQDKGACKLFYPDVWEAYLSRTPEKHWSNPSAYHHERILNGTVEERKESGYAFENLESGLAFLDDRPRPISFDEYDPTSIRIEVHYLHNQCFLPERHILHNASSLEMPVYTVQGRYDMVCPPVTAHELAASIPNSELYWTVAGHVTEHETWNLFKSLLLRASQEK